MHLVKCCRVLGPPPPQQLLRVIQPVGSEGVLGVSVLRQPWIGAPSPRTCGVLTPQVGGGIICEDGDLGETACATGAFGANR